MPRMRRSVFIAALVAGLAAPAWADYDDGVAAYLRGDYVIALRELRPLAEQGHTDAQFKLGFMYHGGAGVPHDLGEAVRWYRLAAEQGHAEAQFNLGAMYSKGLGVPQDYAEAVKWYRLAAEQGNASAMNNLGVKYHEGEGVLQDYVQAHVWYNLAASRLPLGQDRELAAKNRDIVAGRMTPAQVAEAQRLAREWLAKHPSD